MHTKLPKYAFAFSHDSAYMYVRFSTVFTKDYQLLAVFVDTIQYNTKFVKRHVAVASEAQLSHTSTELCP